MAVKKRKSVGVGWPTQQKILADPMRGIGGTYGAPPGRPGGIYTDPEVNPEEGNIIWDPIGGGQWGAAPGQNIGGGGTTDGGTQGGETTRNRFLDVGGINKMPDLLAAVLGDPEYLEGLGAYGLQESQDRQATLNKIRALAVGYGGQGMQGLLTQGLLPGETGGLITQQTLNEAGANKYSTMAMLQRALERGTGRAESRLAAQGLLRSGARAATQNALQEQYQQGSQQAANAFTTNLAELTGGYATNWAAREKGKVDLKNQIRLKLAAMPQYASYQPARAVWDDNYGAYRTADGRLYDPNSTLIGVV